MESFLQEISNDSLLELLSTRFTVINAIGRMESQHEMSRANAMIAYKKDQLSVIETLIKSRFESQTFVAKLESADSEIHYNEIYDMLETIEDAEKELKYQIVNSAGTYTLTTQRSSIDTKQEITQALDKVYRAYLKYTK